MIFPPCTEKAEQAKLSFTEYITRACLGKQIVVIDGLAEVIRQQKAIGKNLNQLTMLCNIVSEYLYDRTVVFGRTIDTNKRAPEMMRGDANAPIGTSSARSHAISLNPSVAISTR